MTPKLCNRAIQSPTPQKGAAFYVDQLGFVITSETPVIELKGANVNLYIDKGPELGPVLEIFVSSLESTKNHLIASGCELVRDEPAVPRCYIRDPFGLVYNLAERSTER